MLIRQLMRCSKKNNETCVPIKFLASKRHPHPTRNLACKTRNNGMACWWQSTNRVLVIDKIATLHNRFPAFDEHASMNFYFASCSSSESIRLNQDECLTEQVKVESTNKHPSDPILNCFKYVYPSSSFNQMFNNQPAREGRKEILEKSYSRMFANWCNVLVKVEQLFAPSAIQ